MKQATHSSERRCAAAKSGTRRSQEGSDWAVPAVRAPCILLLDMLAVLLRGSGRHDSGFDRDSNITDGHRGLVCGGMLMQIVLAVDVGDGSAPLGGRRLVEGSG
jgi:hypothetical protein